MEQQSLSFCNWGQALIYPHSHQHEVISIESELEQVSKKLELLRRELERMASSFELVHQDVVVISQSLDKLIVRYMQLRNQEERIKKHT